MIWRYLKLKDAAEAVNEELQLRRPGDEGLARDMEWLVHHDDWMLLSLVSPLWFPGYAHHRRQQAQVAIDLMAILSRLHAKFVVMGHTPTADGKIDPIFDGRVFRIDTGMHEEHKPGHPAALEIKNGTITAYYSDLPPEALARP